MPAETQENKDQQPQGIPIIQIGLIPNSNFTRQVLDAIRHRFQGLTDEQIIAQKLTRVFPRSGPGKLNIDDADHILEAKKALDVPLDKLDVRVGYAGDAGQLSQHSKLSRVRFWKSNVKGLEDDKSMAELEQQGVEKRRQKEEAEAEKKRLEAPLSVEERIAISANMSERMTQRLQQESTGTNSSRMDRRLTAPPRDENHSFSRTLHMVGDGIFGAVEMVPELEHELVAMSARWLVHFSHRNYDQSQRGVVAHEALNHVLDVWRDNEKFADEEEVYNKYKTRGTKKPEKPHNLIKGLEEDLSVAAAFKFIEDHLLGNFFNVHFSNSRLLNQISEYGIDVVGSEIVIGLFKRQAHLFQHYVAVEMAKEHPAELQPRLKDIAAHDIELRSKSSYPIRNFRNFLPATQPPAPTPAAAS